MYRLVGENLGKYIILTGKANIVILTKVLAVIFTEYNREFCLNLWDPGGRSCECSSDHQPIILFLFQFIDYRLVTYAHWLPRSEANGSAAGRSGREMQNLDFGNKRKRGINSWKKEANRLRADACPYCANHKKVLIGTTSELFGISRLHIWLGIWDLLAH